jgi:ClpP class serine protease
MQTTASAQYKTILAQVTTWSAEERLSLIREILRTHKEELKRVQRDKGTLDSALGLLATDAPAPTDETIHRWISEHKEKKYG